MQYRGNFAYINFIGKALEIEVTSWKGDKT